MDSQGHPAGFNMEVCWACDKILVSHIEIAIEKQRNCKKQLFSQADMW